jgi:hypothetical protein
MRKSSEGAVCIAIVLALLSSAPGYATWVYDGLAISTAADNQTNPMIASDGAGGAIITWHDYRSGNADIYAQRVNASGAAQWTTDGVALCTATSNQQRPTIVSDGTGGAIVTWYDHRGEDCDIHAQRVNASGVVQWMADGVVLCMAAGDQIHPQIVSDGANGAIVTWQDYRSGNYDIYVQRVNASGAVQWAANGVALCTATGEQSYPTIASDGVAGAIVTWNDFRTGTADIYVQRVNFLGTAQWTTDGVVLSAASGHQLNSTIAPDAAGGAIVAWQDYRNANWDIYAQRVTALGTIQWPVDGTVLCTATGTQQYPQIICDGAGGAIITWDDSRSGKTDIYVERVNASGAVQWTANGVALCTAAGYKEHPTIILPDGAGGAIVTWHDARHETHSDIYAQRVYASGAVQWMVDGVALCTAAGDQWFPTVVSDGVGGAIVTWIDTRNGNWDIYAQRIERNGYWGYPAPLIQAVRDIPGDQGGYVNLAWNASRLDPWPNELISKYTVWRAISPTQAALDIKEGAMVLSSPSEISQPEPGRAIRMEQASAGTFYWKLINSLNAYYLDQYADVVPTLFDSTVACSEYHYFQVIAHTADPKVFWISEPDSGRSVDNLSPSTPKSLAGQQEYTPAGLNLTWRPNTEADLGYYAVYRGTSAGFVPDAGNLIATPKDTTLLDSGWLWSGGYYYKVSAIDSHGNESGFALLTPDDVTGSETPKTPAATYLAQNYPNPFNPMTRIEYGLSAPAWVSLRIYDVAGRLARVLVEGDRAPGNYVEAWDGRDGHGAAVASGIWFYRLDAGSFTQTRKMILLR